VKHDLDRAVLLAPEHLVSEAAAASRRALAGVPGRQRRPPDGERLRRCDGARCTRLFVDRSRDGRRRWCEMKGCGDRAKAAAYRQRRRADAT
jgi:predicted RNA-binding Zn ribbon-like protein